MKQTFIRTIPAALAVVAIAVATVLYFGRARPYSVVAEFQDAGQVVKGNQVRIGGATIGSVGDVRLGDDGQAEIVLRITDSSFRPLHRGTQAILRNSSLSSVAGRSITLEPGPNDAPKIKDGGTIPAIDTRSATDLDEVLNAFDVKGRQYLQTLVRGGATAFSGAELATNQILERLSPALAGTRQTIDELNSDEPALQQLVASSAAVSSTLASKRDDLEQGLQATAVTLRAAATEREALRRTIARGPRLLRRANTTLVDTRALLSDARPLLRETRPLAPRLATTLKLTEPLTRYSIPLLRDLRASLPALSDTLDRTPLLADQTVPALTALTGTLNGVRAIVSDVRAYAPDVVAGLATSFGGKAAGYYDANGHYARISPTLNSSSLPGLLQPVLGPLLNLLAPLLGGGLGSPQTQVTNRCPGAAAQTAPDGSNPWPAGHAGGCDPSQVPPGGSNAIVGTLPR